MCSEYLIKTTPQQIQDSLDAQVRSQLGGFQWGGSVKMFTDAPVIQKRGDDLELVLKNFPSSPLPNARLSGLEGQTDGNDNDADEMEHRQVKRIYQASRWKDGFTHHPVLVPMSGFLEFAYWGENQGTAQEFQIPKEDVFFVAGILFKPFKPAGDKTSAFALLTHTATEQMLKTHQRLVVILKGKNALGYLEEMDATERFQYLIEHRFTGHLHQEKFRNMARGWEKRAPVQTSKLHREMDYRKTLNKEKVQG